MGNKIKLEEIDIVIEYDAERVYLTATYRGLLGAKLSFSRPGAGYDMQMLFEFIKTDEYVYIQSKLLSVIQMDLDKLNK